MANKASKLDNCGPPRVTIPDAPTLSELRGMPTDRPDILILEHPAAAQSDRSVLSRTLYTKQSVEANSLVTRPCQRRVTFRGCRHCFGEFSPPPPWHGDVDLPAGHDQVLRRPDAVAGTGFQCRYGKDGPCVRDGAVCGQPTRDEADESGP